MRLIDADKLIEFLDVGHLRPPTELCFSELSVKNIIDLMPTAERTGRWTHVYDEHEKLFFRNKWVCSACGESNTYGMSDFCPCCGAMMENSTRRTKEAEDGE